MNKVIVWFTLFFGSVAGAVVAYILGYHYAVGTWFVFLLAVLLPLLWPLGMEEQND